MSSSPIQPPPYTPTPKEPTKGNTTISKIPAPATTKIPSSSSFRALFKIQNLVSTQASKDTHKISKNSSVRPSSVEPIRPKAKSKIPTKVLIKIEIPSDEDDEESSKYQKTKDLLANFKNNLKELKTVKNIKVKNFLKKWNELTNKINDMNKNE